MRLDSGYIISNRMPIAHSELFTTEYTKKSRTWLGERYFFFYLLFNCAYNKQDNNYKEGTFFYGWKTLAEETDLSKQNLETIIPKLVGLKLITSELLPLGHVITICNYSSYTDTTYTNQERSKNEVRTKQERSKNEVLPLKERNKEIKNERTPISEAPIVSISGREQTNQDLKRLRKLEAERNREISKKLTKLQNLEIKEEIKKQAILERTTIKVQNEVPFINRKAKELIAIPLTDNQSFLVWYYTTLKEMNIIPPVSTDEKVSRSEFYFSGLIYNNKKTTDEELKKQVIKYLWDRCCDKTVKYTFKNKTFSNTVLWVRMLHGYLVSQGLVKKNKEEGGTTDNRKSFQEYTEIERQEQLNAILNNKEIK